MLRARLKHEIALPQLRLDQIPALAAVAFQTAGIRLDENKLDFMQNRLVQRVLDSQAGSFRCYIDLLGSDANERQAFVECLTVHTTSFFRDQAQYNWLRDTVLPELIQHSSNIVLWSAACSTGQEGWTSLIVTDEFRRQHGKFFNCQLIGTDVSTAVVKEASRAVYLQNELDDVSNEVRHRYFLRARNQDGRYRISPELRSNADWRVANLTTGDGLRGISADVAFLRNVLIYFSRPTQREVVDRVVNNIRPGGYLFTGHSETGFKHPDLVAVHPSIYKKVQAS